MNKIERETLLQVCRMRARVAKAEANAVAARRKAEFEAQLAAIYHFDNDEVWKQAHAAALIAVEQAREQIARRARELGIPGAFAPDVGLHWYGRGENAIRERRTELTRVAHRKIDQLEKEAKLGIERASVDIQTKIVADGLNSARSEVVARSHANRGATHADGRRPGSTETIETRRRTGGGICR